jgi:hypothetical protein
LHDWSGGIMRRQRSWSARADAPVELEIDLWKKFDGPDE